MKMWHTKLKQVISLSMLSFFMIANLGFALIHHKCHACSTDSKEIQLFIITHAHNNKELCVGQCGVDDANQCKCKTQHDNECQIDVNRLTTPFISAKETATTHTTKVLQLFSHAVTFACNNYSQPQGNIFQSTPSLIYLSGKDILAYNSVLRL